MQRKTQAAERLAGGRSSGRVWLAHSGVERSSVAQLWKGLWKPGHDGSGRQCILF